MTLLKDLLAVHLDEKKHTKHKTKPTKYPEKKVKQRPDDSDDLNSLGDVKDDDDDKLNEATGRRESGLDTLIDKWQDKERAWHFEGERGERNFEKLVNAIGYHSTAEFFSDNSGAYEALLEWIKSQHSDEWAESLSNELGDSGEEDDQDDDQ